MTDLAGFFWSFARDSGGDAAESAVAACLQGTEQLDELDARDERHGLCCDELSRGLGKASGRDADAVRRFFAFDCARELTHRADADLIYAPAPALQQRYAAAFGEGVVEARPFRGSDVVAVARVGGGDQRAEFLP